MNKHATHIPDGHYLTKTEIAEIRGVQPITVQLWISRGWLPSIKIPYLGHIVNVRDLENFQPPKPGPKTPRKHKKQT